jgi:glycosyltransferase involved in cell wall biosynthesis
MNVLLIHQYFLEDDDAGGSRWNEMAKVWTEMGHEVTVLAGMMHYSSTEKRSEYRGRWFKRKVSGQVNIWRCHVSEAYNTNFLGRLWGYFSFVFSATWAGLFKTRIKFDVVLVTSPPLFIGITGYILSRIKRIPMIFEIRDLWPESAIDTGVVTNKLIIKLAYRLERFIYKRSKLINVLTPAFRKALIEKKHINPKDIIFIPNASDFDLSDNLLETFNAKVFREANDLDQYFVITYVGAHGVANHLDQLLEAAKELEDTNVLFLLVGSGMEKSRLQQLANKMELKNLRFLDPVPKTEVFKYIMASDMGASVLKKVDTFKTIYSNKTFDYMACKKPILMAIDGVSRNLVETADAGIYVEPENPADYNSKIRFYLSNPELRKSQGENGYLFAKANFDRTVLAKKYIELIQKNVGYCICNL